MRRLAFYPRLAAMNIFKNGRFYLPYILTCTGASAMLYIIVFLAANEYISSMPGAEPLRLMLVLGSIVMSIFCAIFLFYTNSFLMKRRRREIGLYNILGMEKRHIARVLSVETVYVALVSLVSGLAAGILLSKLIALLLIRLLRFDIYLGFSVSVEGVCVTLAVFAAIFALTLISNLLRIRTAKPIELLYGSNTGEREPKTRWPLAVLGVLTLGGGYVIALLVHEPLSAILLFFVAVILVIAGTYCLFTSGSIAALKALRANKAYYYKPNHFIAISGMLYRMRRNAVGLANICILSTMVLVAVSTTVSLYIGVEDTMATRYPSDISVIVYDHSEADSMDAIRSIAVSAASAEVDKAGMEVERMWAYSSLILDTIPDGSGRYELADGDGSVWVELCTAAQYSQLTGRQTALEPSQALVWSAMGRESWPELTLAGERLTVTEWLEGSPIKDDYLSGFVDGLCVVVADDSVLSHFAALERAFNRDGAPSRPTVTLRLDVDGRDADMPALDTALDAAVTEAIISAGIDATVRTECRQSASNEFYAVYGGFLFLGIFFGLLFVMGAALIIYYKQLSEGYEDAGRFEIMQKVGMSRADTKSAIRGQILTVFYLPLAGAVVHVAFAFRMMRLMLGLFGLTNVPLFGLCTACIILAFALIYSVIYMLTARTYYRIVRA